MPVAAGHVTHEACGNCTFSSCNPDGLLECNHDGGDGAVSGALTTMCGCALRIGGACHISFAS